MTIQDLTALPDDRLDVMLTELCGWTVIDGIICDPRPEIRHGEPTGDVDMNPVANVPTYTGSLDACAEVRKTLRGKQHPSFPSEQETKFRDNLARILGCAWYQSARLLTAEPREITIALILTLTP